MSDNNKKSTINTLLPPGNIHVFSDSESTLSAFETIKDDWRFSRLKIKVPGENIEDALKYYGENDSPNLMIIQAHTTDESLEKALEGLSEYCEEDTAAIIIGPVNDVRLYRSLMAMGVSDYLVDPVPTEDLINAVGSVLLDMMGTLGSQLVAIGGTKGGVGTSTISQIVALAMSEKLEQKTLLMDAAAGHSSLWSLFGFKPTRTIIEAAKAAVDRDQDELNQIMITPNKHLSVMNSGAERLLDNPAAPQAYEMLLDRMLRLYPNVVVDLSGAPELIQRNILAKANSIYLTTTPTLMSLSLSRSLIKEIQGLRGGQPAPITLINNKKGQATSAEVPDKDISSAVGIEDGNLITIDYDPKFFLGLESEGKEIEKTKEGKELIDVMAKSLASTINLRLPENFSSQKDGALSGILGLFSK